MEERRNTVQHLDTEIDNIAANDFLVWGDLTWLVLIDATIGKFNSVLICNFPSVTALEKYVAILRHM